MADNSLLTTATNFTIPDQILDPWVGKIKGGSTVATLSDSIPMKFGTGISMSVDSGEAEYVGEGSQKGSNKPTITKATVKPAKFHKTVRWSDEVKYADADYQLGVLSQILDQMQPALSRALDFGVFFARDGKDNAISGATALESTTTNVEYKDTDKPYVSLDAADSAVLANSYVPRDIALSPTYASKFATARTTDGVKLYPNLSLGTAVSELDGHRASVSDTVTGPTTTTHTVLAFVGNFSAIRWGVQRAIGLEMIEFGDPDGSGDLKRQNEVAFRVEVVYGWGIVDVNNAFAAIIDDVTS